MKTRIAIIAIAMALSAIANNAQVWTKEDATYAVGPRTTIGISQENRIGIIDWEDGKKHIDEIHVSPSVDYRIAEWMTLGVNYRHVLIRKGTDDRYVNDHRPGIDLAFSRKISDIGLLNRSRFICRVPEGENPYFRYRNLTKVSYAIGDFIPYASYEWYYDEGSRHRPYRKNDRFSQQWITVGLDYKVSENFKATLYYMLTENKDREDHDWYPGHVIGVGVGRFF